MEQATVVEVLMESSVIVRRGQHIGVIKETEALSNGETKTFVFHTLPHATAEEAQAYCLQYLDRVARHVSVKVQ